MLPRTDDDDKRRRRPPLAGRRRLAMLLIVVLLITVAVWLLLVRVPSSADAEQLHFDCVIVPGGGLEASTGEPAAWVAARLDAALEYDSRTDFFLVLSRGTTHKPPPVESGYPVDESAASARYLVARGIAPSRVLLESWSLDTIGNAAFARLMHADLRGWRKMLVVTSAFHRPRTQAIFDWVFSLPDASGRPRRPTAQLSYEEVPERGLDAEQSASRRQKEAQAIEKLQQRTIATISDLQQLHEFLFTRHDAYRAMSADDDAARVRERAKERAWASTY